MYEDENEYHCIYNNIHNLTVIEEDKYNEDNYHIFIHQKISVKNQLIKISVMNVRNEELTYICLISPEKYSLMKKEQNLIVSFDGFLMELQNVLRNSEKNNYKIKMNIGNTISLAIFSQMQMKELLMLYISLEKITSNELIQYYRRKLTCLSLKVQETNEDIINIQKKYDKSIKEHKEEIERIIQEKNILNDEKQTKFTEEIDRMKSENSILAAECDRVLKENEQLKTNVKASVIAICEKKKVIKTMKQEIENVLCDLDHFSVENASLQQELENYKSNSVPREKYDKLSKILSSALAELVKTQMHLQKASTQIEMRKAENSNLRSELEKGIEDVRKLEDYFHSEL